jgi:hypothetical protein
MGPEHVLTLCVIRVYLTVSETSDDDATKYALSSFLIDAVKVMSVLVQSERGLQVARLIPPTPPRRPLHFSLAKWGSRPRSIRVG